MKREASLTSVFACFGALLVTLSGCAPHEAVNVKMPTQASSTSSELLRGAPKKDALVWADYSSETFARAKRERKYVILDGSAEWCHWCHVMEAETYHEPRVRKLLDDNFIAMKVDIDSRPDLEERYGDWGWPATIVFSPDAEEIGKYKGFIAPDDFVKMLEEVVASGARDSAITAAHETPRKQAPILSEETIAWIAHSTEVSLDDYWDEDQGGWGRTQKAAVGGNNAWTLLRARNGQNGNEVERKKALFSLEQESKIIDPVWGGLYQYSAAKDWDHPHFEKLMTFQAPAIENYSDAYAFTHDPKMLARAKIMVRYVDEFLRGPDGGFYTTQDADLNAHDPQKPFLSGHDYYALNDAARRAHGFPRIDTHEYGRENGIAIAAHVSFYDATKDETALFAAKKATETVYNTHNTKRGGIAHDAKKSGDEDARVLYLADNAAFGFGLVRLYEATHDETYLLRATDIATFIEKDLADAESGGLFANSVDPDAAGVFAKRRLPFEHEVMALRFFGHLAKANPAWGKAHGCFVAHLVSAVATPEQIRDQGRWLGDFLLALDDTKGARACPQ